MELLSSGITVFYVLLLSVIRKYCILYRIAIFYAEFRHKYETKVLIFINKLLGFGLALVVITLAIIDNMPYNSIK